MSGFPIKKTLDDFDFSFQPSIDKRQIDELATMRFLENGENVVFLGPPGVGKTHLASALGLVAAQHRFSTYYINCHQLIEQLKKEHDGRISRDNKAWAKTIPMPEDGGDPRHSYVLVVDKVNPGLTDLFLKQARKVLQAPEKGSVLEKLKQEPPERKPAAPKKREPER